MKSILFTTLLCGLLAAVGCGPSPDPNPNGGGTHDAGATDDGGTTGDAGALDDAGSPDSDGGALGDAGMTSDGGPTDAGCSLSDPLDDLGVDDNCDGAEGVGSQSIYVANDGDDIYGGSPQFPVKTLARAFALFQLDHSRRYILVAASKTTYDAEGLGDLLSEGAIVTGGLFREFGWSRPLGIATPKDSTTVSANQRGVVAQIDSQGTALSYVSLDSAQQPDAGGVDTVGLVLSGSVPLTLSHVAIHAGDAADGGDGVPGADAADNSLAFQGAPNFTPQGDFAGPGGHGGAGGPVDGGSSCGSLAPLAGGHGGNRGVAANGSAFPRAEPGAPGASNPNVTPAPGGAAGNAQGQIVDQPGLPGTGGADGAKGTSAQPLMSEAWTFGASTAAIVFPDAGVASSGQLGGGGGGGGGGEFASNFGVFYQGGAAGGGAGGCPGTAGGNGAPGGFSIGLVAQSKWPVFDDVTVSAGNGGKGGAAGAGGQGGAGGLGGVPAGLGSAGAGGIGGAGGAGGAGGDGVPGNGGWSIGILAVSPVVAPSALGGVTVTIGQPGAAGAAVSGGNGGKPGTAVATKNK